jgi:hypothetical protein
MPHPANPPHPSPSSPSTANSGRWFLAGIGLSLVLIGGLFVWLMGRSFLRAYEMRSWPEVPCVILSSETEERRHDENSPIEFRQNLVYSYQWDGRSYTSDRLSLRGSPWTSKPDLKEKRADEWPLGKNTTCFVNPANPDFAVLKPDSLAPGYSIWFPALFVIGGSVMAIRALNIKPPKVSPG